MSGLEETVGAATLCVDDTLGYALAVKVCEEVDVVAERSGGE